MITYPPTSHAGSSRLKPARRNRGLTLVEVMVSSVVLSIAMGGIMATLIQSRRLTEGSVYQNSAVTIMQGYVEQMKNMEYSQVIVSAATEPPAALKIPTMLDQSSPDPLTLSWGTPPATMPAAGAVPTGGVTNTRVIDINNTPTNTKDDLEMKLWVWVQDLTGTSPDVVDAKAITVIYNWKTKDGGRERITQGSVRTIRSLVPSF